MKNIFRLKNTNHISKAEYAKVRAYERILPILSIWEKITKEHANAIDSLEKDITDFYSYDPIPETVKLFNVEINTKS